VDEPTVVVGRVTRAHGVRGEVAVENRSDNPDRWALGATVFLDSGRPLTIASVRPHAGRLLVTFAEIDDRTQAVTLAGHELVVPGSWVPELDDGQWWAFEIEGCAVATESGRRLGHVEEVLPYPAHDIWRVVDEHGAETMIPAVEAFVVSVDAKGRSALVRDVPGLTAPEDA
jgi:16S rRNA processing protein RimM